MKIPFSIFSILRSYVSAKDGHFPFSSSLRRRGQVLLLAVLALGGTMIVVTAIAGFIMLFQIRQVGEVENSARAIFAADAGVECGLYNTRFPGGCPTSANLSNGARYEITVDQTAGTLLSRGISGAAGRRVNRAFLLNIGAGGSPPPPATPTLTVSPASQSISVGGAQQFIASYDPDGSGPISPTDVTTLANWLSSNLSVAMVSSMVNIGLATGVGAGTATITASYLGTSGTATLTVGLSGSIVSGEGMFEITPSRLLVTRTRGAPPTPASVTVRNLSALTIRIDGTQMGGPFCNPSLIGSSYLFAPGGSVVWDMTFSGSNCDTPGTQSWIIWFQNASRALDYIHLPYTITIN